MATNLHGATSISRVVNVFEIRDMRCIPWTKYKIKVLEEVSGGFLAVANVCVKNANGTPDREAGLGRTEVEALQDLIMRLGERLNSHVADLIPDKLASAIADVEAELLKALAALAPSDLAGEKWLVRAP